MNTIKLIFSWFVQSSKNPENLSLTLKGLIGVFVMLGIADANNAKGATDALVNVFVIAGQLITALIALWGFIRKIYLTFKSK